MKGHPARSMRIVGKRYREGPAPHCPRRRTAPVRRGNRRTDAVADALRGSGRGLGLPEDLVDLGDVVQQLLTLGGVHAALAAGGAGPLGGLVEQLVQPRVLLEVRGLEVVGPQHPQVVLDQVGAGLLDQDRAGAEGRVLVRLVLLLDRLDGLRLDAGLGRVVDAAGEVAVRGGLDGGEHAGKTHGCTSGCREIGSSGTLLAVIGSDSGSGVAPLPSAWAMARVTGP